MSLESIKDIWETLGKQDPLWAVLTIRRYKYNRWDPDEFFETGRNEISAVIEYIKKQGVEVNYDRALDFGCGVGRLSQALGDHFQDVVGLDISEPMLQRARNYNRHGDRCQYVLNTTDHLEQFADGTFDFVYSNIALQHVQPEHSIKYMAEFFRVLRPGGVVFFQMPSERARQTRNLADHLRRFRLSFVSPLRRRWKQLRGIPLIDVFPVHRHEVEQLIRSQGAELVTTIDDKSRELPILASAGKVWESYRYCAVKRGHNPNQAAA